MLTKDCSISNPAEVPVANNASLIACAPWLWNAFTSNIAMPIWSMTSWLTPTAFKLLMEFAVATLNASAASAPIVCVALMNANLTVAWSANVLPPASRISVIDLPNIWVCNSCSLYNALVLFAVLNASSSPNIPKFCLDSSSSATTVAASFIVIPRSEPNPVILANSCVSFKNSGLPTVCITPLYSAINPAASLDVMPNAFNPAIVLIVSFATVSNPTPTIDKSPSTLPNLYDVDIKDANPPIIEPNAVPVAVAANFITLPNWSDADSKTEPSLFFFLPFLFISSRVLCALSLSLSASF